MTAPGWYPDPWSTWQRYHDGQQWTAHSVPMPRAPQPNPRLHWAVWVAIGGFVVAAATLAGFGLYNSEKPVRNAHSDVPGMEGFYRDVEAMGFGNMKVSDANSRGKQACDGDGLVLWGIADYSMADSFNFATAALQACPALRRTR